MALVGTCAWLVSRNDPRTDIRELEAKYPGVNLRRLTTDEFEKILSVGIIKPEEQVKLVNGVIMLI